MNFTIEQMIDFTEKWLITGELNDEMLSDDFQFISPFWESNNREEFVKKFHNSPNYQNILNNIIKFDPIIKFKSLDGKYFSIVLQYFTKNGCRVYETVLGTIRDDKLAELRSIYDLEETKKAHELE